MSDSLSQIYELRFSGLKEYRNNVWKILVEEYFQKWIRQGDRVLDLGCGYGEFINNLSNCEVHAMDLNPDAIKHLREEVTFHGQDCSEPWAIAPNSLDVIFTSNFFEHLPNKEALSRTIAHVKNTLKPGGRVIALGPNISVLKGKYWDFWDHHVALSDQSLGELFEIHGLTIEKSIPRFLPYNMVRVRQRPLFLVSLYLKMPWLWLIVGKQFLVVAQKQIT